MPQDKRYSTIKVLIETGRIQCFRQIFDFIPKSVVYGDLGTNYERFTNLLANPELFTLQELITMAGFFDMDAKILIDLTYEQHLNDKKNKKRK